MKKVTSIILCTFLLICLTACGAQNENEDLLTEDDVKSTTSLSEAFQVYDNEMIANEKEESIAFKKEKLEDEKAFADRVITMYLSGEWDGNTTMLDGHEISLSRRGELLVDGYLSSTSKWHCQHPIDLPEPFKEGNIDSCNTICIPGKGTYVLIDETYYKYLRGKKISKGLINWKKGEGIDVDYGHAVLHYCDKYDRMFLTTPMLTSIDEYGVPMFDPIAPTYLYVFPDYDTAKIEYVGRACELEYDESHFRYFDEDGICWVYTEENETYAFKKISD